jgi:hypothetical protein
MRVLPPALIAALLVAAAGPVHAQEPGVFGYFRAICGPDLDPARAAARAADHGFAPAKKKPKAGALDEAQGYEKTVGGKEFFVITGRARGKPKDGLPASATLACGVGVKGKDEAALAAGRKWVGVPVSKSVLGVAFHGFTQAGGRKPLDFDDKPAVKAALMAGDMNVLTISGLGGVTVLMLSKTRPAS